MMLACVNLQELTNVLADAGIKTTLITSGFQSRRKIKFVNTAISLIT
jgi:hypothetical protein